jgi:uncharacterized protein YoxC
MRAGRPDAIVRSVTAQPDTTTPIRRPERTWLGMPWFATLALSVAAILLVVIVVLLTQQFAVLQRMDANTARINGTVTNTELISSQLAGLQGNTRLLPHLDRASADFFTTAAANLNRTGSALPGVSDSLASLRASAAPAFAALGSGALENLPSIASGLDRLEALAALPGELDGNLQAMRTELSALATQLEGISGTLGTIGRSLAALRDLRQVRADTSSLPALAGTLRSVLALLGRLDSQLGDIDRHVSNVDQNTAVLGAAPARGGGPLGRG